MNFEFIMRVLLIGDIVGSPGRDAVKKIIPGLRARLSIDFVIANAENIAGGSGITPDTAEELLKNKVDVLTSGDHIWKKKDIYQMLAADNRILRPANYPEACPGRGAIILNTASGKKIGILNLLGRVFMDPIDCPFIIAEKEIKKMREVTPLLCVDIHAEATSEKIALGRFLDGRVSVVFGTHTHVQTADEKILPDGTAYITDVGMTGAQDSIIGRRHEPIVEHFLTSMPKKFELADKDVELQAVLVEIDERSGRALYIQRIREKLP